MTTPSPRSGACRLLAALAVLLLCAALWSSGSHVTHLDQPLPAVAAAQPAEESSTDDTGGRCPQHSPVARHRAVPSAQALLASGLRAGRPRTREHHLEEPVRRAGCARLSVWRI